MSERICFSIVITAHNEGLLAHKTILSVLSAFEGLKEEGISTEIIIHIDNGDKETKDYFSGYKNKEGFRVFENDFGDLGLSRNYAIKKAKGKYVGVLDADDLVSKDWFILALEKLKESEDDVVVHPNYSLAFGLDCPYVLWEQNDSFGAIKDMRILCGVNRWVSTCITKKEVFEKCPYASTCDGYGNEDWWFNTETEYMGIRHVVASGTVLFYRQKGQSKSLLQASNSLNRVQRYTHLFEMNYYRTKVCQEEKREIENKQDYNVVYGVYKRIRESKLNIVITPVARPIRIGIDKLKGFFVRSKELVPGSVYEAWKNISEIETGLYPTKSELEKVIRYYVEEGDAVGGAYFEAMKDVKKLPDYVFFVPWLVSGGGDKVLLNYITALSELHKDWTFAVVTTLPSKNEWKDKLPENSYIVDYGNNSKYLNDAEEELLFSRIITQLKCKRIHVINSQYAYAWISNHLELVKKNYKLNVSVFCHDYIKGTGDKGVFDYMDPYLLSIYSVVNNIFTDNKRVVRRGVELCGFSEERFKVHYQPVDNEIIAPRLSDGNPCRILWAGRIAYQKAPDILLKVAERLNPDEVCIDVFGKLDGYRRNYFCRCPALNYKGGFDGFESLRTEGYDFYLYTSRIDGLPNCILEATAAGLPIIAPDVGGIGEFIENNKTGLLVSKFDDIEGYIEAIRFAMDNRDKMVEMAKKAQRLLKKRHSRESFDEAIIKDFDS